MNYINDTPDRFTSKFKFNLSKSEVAKKKKFLFIHKILRVWFSIDHTTFPMFRFYSSIDFNYRTINTQLKTTFHNYSKLVRFFFPHVVFAEGFSVLMFIWFFFLFCFCFLVSRSLPWKQLLEPVRLDVRPSMHVGGWARTELSNRGWLPPPTLPSRGCQPATGPTSPHWYPAPLTPRFKLISQLYIAWHPIYYKLHCEQFSHTYPEFFSVTFC